MSSPIFGQLEAALAEYLTDVTHRAHRADDRSAAGLARHEVPRLVAALRAVLAEHTPDQSGRCSRCRPTRLGRTPTPCRAYLSAHLCLVAAEEEPAAPPQPRPAVEATPIRRPVVFAEPARLRGAVNLHR